MDLHASPAVKSRIIELVTNIVRHDLVGMGLVKNERCRRDNTLSASLSIADYELTNVGEMLYQPIHGLINIMREHQYWIEPHEQVRVFIGREFNIIKFDLVIPGNQQGERDAR